MRVEIPIFDGFDEIDVFGPFEVLSSGGFEVVLVGIEQAGTVVSMRGVRIEVEAVLGAPDVLLIPGGGWLDRAPRGAWAQAQKETLPNKIAELARTTPVIASVCTGSLLLAASGVLAGRQATTNHNAYQELAAFGVEVIRERVVDDGKFVTAGGLTAGIDLGFWLVEREFGTALADEVSRGIEYDRQGRVWRSARSRAETSS